MTSPICSDPYVHFEHHPRMLSCALVAFNDEALKDRRDMCHVQVTHAHCKLAHIHPLRDAARILYIHTVLP